MKKHILLTGPPGIGKTTVMVRLAERLSDRIIAGFYTEEIREGGQRQGFRVATFSGSTATLAHVGIRRRHRVGRYGVDVRAFEGLVVPELSRPSDILLIDEIGKMECLSSRFATTVRELLDGHRPMVATVAVKGGGFIAEVKARPDVETWELTGSNREQLPQRLVAALG